MAMKTAVLMNMKTIQVVNKDWKDGLQKESLSLLAIAFRHGGQLDGFSTDVEVGYLNFSFPSAKARKRFKEEVRQVDNIYGRVKKLGCF
jgi:hypothetical protein